MIFFVSALVLSAFSFLDLHNLIAPHTQWLHESCLTWIPDGQSKEINAALLCAEPLTDEFLKDLFIKSSLYHLIVVSGGHLTVLSLALEISLQKISGRYFSAIVLLSFIIFAFMCNLQPPIVRAVFALILSSISSKKKLNFKAHQILLLSVLCSLAFHPQWLNSRSLMLSAICSLALVLHSHFKWPKSLQSIIVFILLVPFLWGWGNLHPIGIVMNLVLAPLVSLIWIPAAVLSCLSDSFRHVYEISFHEFIHFLEMFLDPVEKLTTKSPFRNEFLWFLFWMTGLSLHVWNIREKQIS